MSYDLCTRCTGLYRPLSHLHGHDQLVHGIRLLFKKCAVMFVDFEVHRLHVLYLDDLCRLLGGHYYHYNYAIYQYTIPIALM